jgi:hypothetical protein
VETAEENVSKELDELEQEAMHKPWSLLPHYGGVLAQPVQGRLML